MDPSVESIDNALATVFGQSIGRFDGRTNGPGKEFNSQTAAC